MYYFLHVILKLGIDYMHVLSLFDGMSCAQIALNKMGITSNIYMSSEIDKYAINATQNNYPKTIQLGDINKINSKISGRVDLLIGGSPCQGFSSAGKQLNFDDPRSKLFFEFVRLLNEVKPTYFLLENVNMKKEYRDIISKHLKVEPIQINSSLVSAQNRKRLYWTNIPQKGLPKDKKIIINDILEHGFADRTKSYCLTSGASGNLDEYFEKHRKQLVFSKGGLCHVGNANLKGNESIRRVYHPSGKCPTLTTMCGGHRQPKILYKKSDRLIFLRGLEEGRRLHDGKSNSRSFREGSRIYSIKGKSVTLTSSSKGGKGGFSGLYGDSNADGLFYRKLTPLECERLQTIPDNYTVGVSNTQRYKMIGNGFTIDVIAHLLKGMDTKKFKRGCSMTDVLFTKESQKAFKNYSKYSLLLTLYEAKVSYYTTGNSKLSDREYDALESTYEAVHHKKISVVGIPSKGDIEEIKRKLLGWDIKCLLVSKARGMEVPNLKSKINEFNKRYK